MNKNTIEQLTEEMCTGCMMCGDVCPKGAISFQTKSDGFWYPAVDNDLCIHCGLCYAKCPQINCVSRIPNRMPKCYGAKTKKEDIRWQSTSGGFFTELASSWMKNGGICIGAVYDDECHVYHSIEKNKSGIERLRQSKYVQSKTAGIYHDVKTELSFGNLVMFCGTPCQVSALYAYLSKEYDNLLTMDFVCCGICSPGIYDKYLEMLEKRYHSKVKKVWFKNKSAGWRSIGTKVEFANGKTYFRTGGRDLFMLSFVTDALSMRGCCENCKYRSIPHDSDFTVADFWGVEKVNPEFDDNRGLSAVFVNTKKGETWFNRIECSLDYFETTVDDIAKGNFTVYKPKKAHPKRKEFFECVNATSFRNAMNIYGSYQGVSRLKTDCGYWKHILKEKIRELVRR